MRSHPRRTACLAALLAAVGGLAAWGAGAAAVAGAAPVLRAAAQAAITHSFITEPNFHPPVVTLSRKIPDRGAGYIFLDSQNSGQPAAYFLNSRVDLRWYQPSATTGHGPSIFNVRVQGLEGQPVLTYWRGVVNKEGIGSGKGLILNEHYQTIHTVTAGGGYQKRGIDLHEFTLGRHGSKAVAFVQLWSPVQKNLTSVGGPANGTAINWIIQEIDIATNKVIWQWRSLSHVPISASSAPYVPGQPYDYFHLNSIQPLSDGHIIISARNTSAIYSINERTGKIDWQLGGKHSSFAMGTGTRFYWQHHATLHARGLLTVFDDGAPPPREPQSRALKIHLGIKDHRATLVRQDVHNPTTLAYGQGSAQILPNHNFFVGWGTRPYFSEYTPAGTQIFSGAFRAPVQSYRAYRSSGWVGMPLQRPAVAARKTSAANRYNVYASWNGSTKVMKWQVLGSSSRGGRFTRVGSPVPWSSFETRIPITSRDSWFEVEAIDIHGNVLTDGTSAAANP